MWKIWHSNMLLTYLVDRLHLVDDVLAPPEQARLHKSLSTITDLPIQDSIAWPSEPAGMPPPPHCNHERAHTKTACLGCACCRQLRQQLVHEEPAAVEAELCKVAAEQQQSVQEGRRTEPAAGTEAHQQQLPTPDPDRSTDATVSHQ